MLKFALLALIAVCVTLALPTDDLIGKENFCLFQLFQLMTWSIEYKRKGRCVRVPGWETGIWKSFEKLGLYR